MASLWDQFTDNLSRGFDQLNPFDNGKDWNQRTANPVIKKKRDEPVIPNRGNGPLRMQPQTQPKPVTPAKPVQPKPFGQTDDLFTNKVQPKPQIAPDGSVADTRPMPMRVPNDHVQDANRALRGNTVVNKTRNDVSAAEQLRAELSSPRPNKARVQALTQQVRGNTTQEFDKRAANERIRQVAEVAATPVKVIDEVMRTTGQAINSTPEVIARSLIAEPLSGNAFRRAEDAVDTSGTHTNPVAKYLFGEKVESYQGQARGMQIAAQNSDNEIIKGIAPAVPFAAPLLAGLDLAGVKGGKMAADVLPVGTNKPPVQAPNPVSTPPLQRPVQAPVIDPPAQLANDADYHLEANPMNSYDLIQKEDVADIIATQRKWFNDENVAFNKQDADKSVMGTYKWHDDLINLVEGTADKHTYYHETVHKAIGQFLDDTQIEQLYSDIVKLRGGKLKLQNKYREIGYKDASWRTAAEEEISNSFADFMSLGFVEGTTKLRFQSWDDKAYFWAKERGFSHNIATIFSNLAQKIEAFVKAPKTKALDNVEGFYNKIKDGGFHDAPRRTTKYERPKNIEQQAADALVNVKNGALDIALHTAIKTRAKQPVFDTLMDARYGKGRAAAARSDEPLAKIDEKPLSLESRTILDRLDDEIKKEDDIIRQEAEFEIERLNEMIMDPATPDAQIPILTKQVLDVKDQIARVTKDTTTPIEQVTKRDTTLDGLKVDPETTIRDRQGNLVDTTTGEILDDTARDIDVPTKPKTAVEYAAEKLDEVAPELKPDTRPLPERVAALPDSKAAQPEDLPTIERSVTDVEKELDSLADTTTPEQRKQWAVEMANFNRNGTPLSDESAALQDQIQDLMDAFKRDGFGDARKDGKYLPEATPEMLESAKDTKLGSTFLDMVNSTFDFKAARGNKIDPESLADPLDTLRAYNQKWHYDNYGHLKEAQKLKEKGYTKPVEYLNTKKEIAKHTAASVDKELTKALSKEAKGKVTTRPKLDKKYDLYGELVKNFDKHGNPAEIVTNKVHLPMGANAHVTREMWKKTGIYDDAGMHRYDNAQGQGMGVFEEIGGKDALEQFKAMGDEGLTEYTNTVKGFYEDVYTRDFADFMDKYTFDEIVSRGAAQSYKYESGNAIAGIERNLAAERLLHYAERTRFTDPHVAKKFKNEVSYILKDSRRAMGVADKVTNFLTSMYHTGALGLNPQSAVQQISEFARVAGMTDGETTFRAIYDSVRQMKPGEIRAYLDSFGLHDSFTKQMLNKGDEVLRDGPKKVKTTGQKLKEAIPNSYDWVQEATMKGFNAFETAKDVTLLKALERKHAGIADPYARRTAIMDEFNRAGFKGSHFGAIEATNRSNIARLGLQFGQYTMKDWGLMAEKVRNGDWGYVRRTVGGKVITAVPLYAIFGTSVAFTLGLSEYKGGPAVGLATLTFTEIDNENKRVQNAVEKGTGEQEFNWDNVKNGIAKKQGALTVPGGNYLLNKLGVQDSFEAGREADFLRHDTAIGDMNRGYNEAQKGYNEDGTGNARFAAPDDLWNQAKAILGGAYNTDEANDYFKNGFFDLSFWGINVGEEQTDRPVSDNYQKKIDANPKDAAAIIEQSRAQQAEKKAYFDKNPDLKETWDAMNKTTWNKETQKNESDTISPERWKTVLGSKDGKMFEYMRDRAKRNHEDFGDPIDPIYLLTDKGQINDALTVRAAFTGDDKEKKASLKEQEWYRKYSDDLDKYYDSKDVQAKDPNSDFGSTKRAQEYYELSQQNPYVATPKSAVLQKYEAIKASGDEAGRKAFYKANADALGAEYEKLSEAAFNWTNQMRKLEGASPLTREVWENPTYGYKSDGIINGKDDTNGGYTKYSGNRKNTVSVKTGSFGKAGTGTPNALKTGKVKTVARKARTRKGAKNGKITFKRSKTV